MKSVKDRIEVVDADITQLAVDAIVNAANTHLASGGGVCGAIHLSAGPGLAEECRALIAREGPCATGDAKLTGGHGLRARFVIHAVGPVWSGGDAGEDAQLASAYARALTLARDVGAQSIAFPAISTGIYGFPAERAANIAVAAIMSDLVAHEVPARVVLCCFGAQSAAIYLRVLENVSLGDKVHKI